MIRPRLEYHALGRTPEERQKYYQALFQKPLDKATLNEIREATNKSWVLGDNKFKEAVEQQLARRVTPIAKGGDRKSSNYLELAKINLL